jgi:ketosteroid isomerase-like protein
MEGVLETFWDEFDDARIEVHELIEAGDQVLVTLTMRGRGKQSGAEASWTFWQLWTVRDGEVVRGQGVPKQGGGPRSRRA